MALRRSRRSRSLAFCVWWAEGHCISGPQGCIHIHHTDFWDSGYGMAWHGVYIDTPNGFCNCNRSLLPTIHTSAATRRYRGALDLRFVLSWNYETKCCYKEDMKCWLTDIGGLTVARELWLRHFVRAFLVSSTPFLLADKVRNYIIFAYIPPRPAESK